MPNESGLDCAIPNREGRAYAPPFRKNDRGESEGGCYKGLGWRSPSRISEPFRNVQRNVVSADSRSHAEPGVIATFADQQKGLSGRVDNVLENT